MPKMKTRSSVKKRFKLTAKGHLKRKKRIKVIFSQKNRQNGNVIYAKGH